MYALINNTAMLDAANYHLIPTRYKKDIVYAFIIVMVVCSDLSRTGPHKDVRLDERMASRCLGSVKFF